MVAESSDTFVLGRTPLGPVVRPNWLRAGSPVTLRDVPRVLLRANGALFVLARSGAGADGGEGEFDGAAPAVRFMASCMAARLCRVLARVGDDVDGVGPPP